MGVSPVSHSHTRDKNVNQIFYGFFAEGGLFPRSGAMGRPLSPAAPGSRSSKGSERPPRVKLHDARRGGEPACRLCHLL